MYDLTTAGMTGGTHKNIVIAAGYVNSSLLEIYPGVYIIFGGIGAARNATRTVADLRTILIIDTSDKSAPPQLFRLAYEHGGEKGMNRTSASGFVFEQDGGISIVGGLAADHGLGSVLASTINMQIDRSISFSVDSNKVSIKKTKYCLTKLFCTHNESPGNESPGRLMGPRCNCAAAQYNSKAFIYGGMYDRKDKHALHVHCDNRYIYTKELGSVDDEHCNCWTSEKIVPDDCLLEISKVQMLVENEALIYLMAGSIERQEDATRNIFAPNESIVVLSRTSCVEGTSVVFHWKRTTVCNVQIDKPQLLLKPVLAIVEIGPSKQKCVALYGGYNTSVYLSTPLQDLSNSGNRNLILGVSTLLFTEVAGVVGTGGWWSNGTGMVNGNTMLLFGGTTCAGMPNQGFIEVDLSNLDGASTEKSLKALQAARDYENRNRQVTKKKQRRHPNINVRENQKKERKLLTTNQLKGLGKQKFQLFLQHKNTKASPRYLTQWTNMHLVSLHIQTCYPVIGQPSVVNITKEEFTNIVEEQQHLNDNPREHELYDWVGALLLKAIETIGKESMVYLSWEDVWRPADFATKRKASLEQQKKEQAQQLLNANEVKSFLSSLIDTAVHTVEEQEQERQLKREVEEEERQRKREVEEVKRQDAITLRHDTQPFCNFFHFKKIQDSLTDVEYGVPPKLGANKHLIIHHTGDYWNGAAKRYEVTQCSGCEKEMSTENTIAFCKNCSEWEVKFPHPDTAKNNSDKLIFPGNFNDGKALYCEACLPLRSRKRSRKRKRSQEEWKVGVRSVKVNDTDYM